MLVSKEHKKLILNLRDPDRVLTVIPTARLVQHQEHNLVVVPHRLDEVRVLRNLGIDAPMPVRYYYDFPCAYPSPLEHQIATVEFLVGNPRSFCLNEMGCVDSETEYLSPSGWRKISEYSGGQVAQYRPDTGAAEFVDPLEYVKLPCERMVRIKTKYGLDQLLSREHRVLLVDALNPSRQEVVLARELLERQEAAMRRERMPRDGRIGFSHAAIPVTFEAPDGDGLDLSDAQIRLMVACIADGSFPCATARCVVRVKKPRKVERLRRLLADADVKYRETIAHENRIDAGFHIFTFTAPRREKEFGAQWWSCTRRQLAIVADEVLHWDGSLGAGARGDQFASSSRQSADFVQYVFVGTGRTARLTTYSDRPTNVLPLHELKVRKNGRPLHLKSVSSTGELRQTVWEQPSTDGFKYCFLVPSTFLIFRRNGCVFASGNTMKTLSALWAFDYLRSQKAVHRALILAPLSALERAWGDEIFRNFPEMTFGVLHGTRERRHKLLAHPFDVYIINHDGIKSADTLKLICEREDIDLIIVDEIAEFRNTQTERYKSLKQIVKTRKWVWGLTGTPIPNAPTDAYAQCRLISPGSVPPYFSHFRDQVMRPISKFKWAPRENALDLVRRAMQPAIRFRRAECIDLPPTTYVTRTAELTPEQKKLYKDMVNKAKAEFDGGQITAVNEAVKVNKLVQICCGVAYAHDEDVIIPAEPRIELLREIISEAGAKVIVFVPLTGALNQVAEKLRSDWSVEVVHGETPKRERDRIFAAFQKETDPHVLVANPGTMSHSLTLTAADTVVWFAPINSNNIYEQANARVPRPGQKLNTLIVHIEGSPIERSMYERLQKRGKMQGVLLEMLEGE